MSAFCPIVFVGRSRSVLHCVCTCRISLVPQVHIGHSGITGDVDVGRAGHSDC